MLLFNREKLTVETSDEQIVLSALMHDIKADGPLMAKLARKWTSGTLRQFTNKVEEFINQEETISTLMKSKPEESRLVSDLARATPKTFVEKKKKRDHQKVRTPEKKIELPPRHNQQQQYLGWTPLNTTIYKVFMEGKKDPSFRWPRKIKALPQNRTTQKFCEYHNDHEHYTEDCISLRFEIEKLLRNGKLLKFVAEEKGREKNPQGRQSHRSGPNSGPNNNNLHNQRQKRDEPRIPQNNQQSPQNQTVVGEIRTIAGGLAGGGESSSARKAYIKQARIEEVFSLEKPSKVQKQEPNVLTFSEEDAKEISTPHDNVLVITLTMANHAIHRVLVDNGSSADILYWTVV
ncbi:uncharacterized protein LOC132185303 [Corylus avellana]|uniref:uncharacterized protein LOC132185303 n=1 Tax=Corylus avellana TaxID=13451 RepID=UPI00286BDC09|nr:uncharacterized protein LOC132185303 [Corylus avellana]